MQAFTDKFASGKCVVVWIEMVERDLGSCSQRFDDTFEEEGGTHHHVSVHAHDASVHRDERNESPRTVDMSRVEDVVTVRPLRLPRWSCHVNFVHSCILGDRGDMHVIFVSFQEG